MGMQGKVKIVYKDDHITKVLFGCIETEDTIFLTIIAEDGTKFRLNKHSIISIKALDGRRER